MSGPFDLADVAAYARWREQKRDLAPRRIEEILVEIGRGGQRQDAPRIAFEDDNRAVEAYQGPLRPNLQVLVEGQVD